MPRPSWWPKREYIHSATGEWCEAKCQAAEQAMAKAIIAEIERRSRMKSEYCRLFINFLPEDWQALKKEALDHA